MMTFVIPSVQRLTWTRPLQSEGLQKSLDFENKEMSEEEKEDAGREGDKTRDKYMK